MVVISSCYCDSLVLTTVSALYSPSVVLLVACQFLNMTELFRDTIIGKALRLLSHGKLYPFAEEQDPSLWQQYVHLDKTQEMASHGRLLEEHEKHASGEGDSCSKNQANKLTNNVPEPIATLHDTARTRNSGTNDHMEEPHTINAIGHTIDPEKGRDTNVVEWYSSEDPEVGGPYSNILLIISITVARITMSNTP